MITQALSKNPAEASSLRAPGSCCSASPSSPARFSSPSTAPTSWASSSGYRSSRVRSCISSCMEVTVGTAVTGPAIRTIVKGAHHEYRNVCLWPMGPGDRQLACLHPICLHFLQTANGARLAIVRCIQCFSGRTFHGNVRLSAHHLFPVRLAAESISQSRLVVARCGPSPGNDVRLEDESPFRTLPHAELRLHLWRICHGIRCLAGALH